MFKKNTRKRLLAGALATVMMLTMCPTTWALADDEDIATPLPLVDENRPVVESAPVEADTTKTPADPTPSDSEAKPAENQNTAPAPSDDEANGGTDSTESGNNNASSDVSEDSKNNSQNNDVVSNSPENEISTASLDVDTLSWNDVQTIDAEYWITNRRAVADGTSTLEIASDRNGITDADGLAITDIVPNERAATTTDGSYHTVFWQARVQHILHQGTGSNDDKTQFGTEITRIRYTNGKHGWDGKFEYLAKGSDEWTKFALATDHLVFYYLIRTEYSDMVQIDVSDWTVDKEDTQYRDRRSVTYKVIVDNPDGADNGTVLASRKFWYNKAFTVSSVRVREIGNHPNYSINRVALEPDNLGKVNETNNEFQFSLDLTRAKCDEATVKIYVSATSHELSYNANNGTLKGGSYSQGKVYPQVGLTLPTDAEITRDGYTFDGWYDEANHKRYQTGDPMPNNDLTLTAHWNANPPVTPPVEPETTTPAKYFVLLPNRGKPDDNHDQGEEFYLPSSKSNGGVDGLDQSTGYVGSLTQKGANAVPHKGDSVTNIATGFSDEYLNVPSNLGFFDEEKWANGTYNGNSANTDILGENFNVHNISIVWYTIKNQGIKDGKLDIHVDGYVAGAPVKVTYHPNYGTIPGMSAADYVVPATSGDTHIVRENMFTIPNGYTFGGWYVDGTKYEVGSDHLLMTELDLYAKWVPINSEVSYFYKNEQNVDTQFEGIDTYAFGTDVTVRTAHPEKEGYTFTCWTNIKNIVTVDADGKFKMPAENVRFDATFKINQYNVTYKVDGKEVGTDVYDFNSDVVIRDVPTKEGYTFTGWKIGTADAKNFKMPAHDVTIEGTFAKNSSGGHHRRPTVTIPDEVPTGLNGNDHYAYIVGYPDKTVRPQNGITRAEVATIFFRLLTDETRDANSTKSNSYSDVAAGAWYNHAVSTLSAMGIVKGSNGKFNPNAPITRAEFAAIAARFDDKANTTTADFSDIASHWAKNEISAASNNGWINGYPDGTFRPDNKITRAEAMTLVNRVLKRLPETEEDLHDDMIKWSDNSDVSQWFYLAVQEATNSHYYQTKENQFEKWTELRETRDWTELEK